MRSPGYKKAINLLSQIWDSFPNELIVKSFETDGITANLGSELKSMINNDRLVNEFVVDHDDTSFNDAFDEEEEDTDEDEDGSDEEEDSDAEECDEAKEKEAPQVILRRINPKTTDTRMS